MIKVNSFVNAKAVIILFIMCVLLVGSIWNDSATMDELAHIPAGFGYVTQFDYRLNPEHPPLIKYLSSLSGQLFAKPYFPTNTPYWQEYVNRQWDQGRVFLYESGNDADKIIFWSRIPVILLTILFGWLLFAETKKRFGKIASLIALTLFAFSPTFLAHSRYVTTDLAAAFGFFIGIITYVRYVESPSKKTLALAGIAFGVAQLLKFSLILLIPSYAIFLLVWIFGIPNLNLKERAIKFIRLGLGSCAVGAFGFLLVWILYIPAVWNYPQERQLSDTKFILSSYPLKPIANLNIALVENSFTRPFGQYLFGFLMVSQRAGSGNTGYYLGEVSATGSRSYFPVLYLLKEHLAFHILTLLALGIAITKTFSSERMRSGIKGHFDDIRSWIYRHPFECASLIFIAVYWGTSIRSPLNIGVRHVLPTFPFLYILVARQISGWLTRPSTTNPQNILELLRGLYESYTLFFPKVVLIKILLLWIVVSSILVFPHYLSYYNALAGGQDQGHEIAVDSNYDWGQDLKRLHDFVEQNRIEEIAIDYFGGGNPEYYFKEKYVPWWSSKGPRHGWFAISATFEQGAFGTPAPGFIRKPEDSYEWLLGYEPVARAGKSIFIYNLP